MSGYMGTTPKKIRRGVIEIPNRNEIINYIETEDESFSTDPIKEYYELINGEYVLTDDVTMQSGKTYYEYHPHYGKLRKTIRKAWVGDENNEPALVLDAPYYIYEGYVKNRFNAATPYNISNYSCTVLFDNKVHILGGGSTGLYTKHYSWDGTEWSEESTLPYEFSGGCAVVLDNKIHILGGGLSGTSHYSWDGTAWSEESTLPYEFAYGSAIVYNNSEIHILGGDYRGGVNTQHYSWDGTTWISRSTLPFSLSNITTRGNAVFLTEDETGICIGTYRYCWKASSPTWTNAAYPSTKTWKGWTELSKFGDNVHTWGPDNGVNFGGLRCVIPGGSYKRDAAIFIGRYFCGRALFNQDTSGSYAYQYIIDIKGVKYYEDLDNYGLFILYDHKIYAFANGKVYYYNEFIDEWLTIDTEPSIPYYFYHGFLLLKDNKLNLFGSYFSKYGPSIDSFHYPNYEHKFLYTSQKKYNDFGCALSTLHFEFDNENETWVNKIDLNQDNQITMNSGIHGAVMYNDELYLLIERQTDPKYQLWKYDQNNILTIVGALPEDAVFIKEHNSSYSSGVSNVLSTQYPQPMYFGVIGNKLYLYKLYYDGNNYYRKFYLWDSTNGFVESSFPGITNNMVSDESNRIYYSVFNTLYNPTRYVERIYYHDFTTNQNVLIKTFSSSSQNNHYWYSQYRILRNSMVLFDNYVGIIYDDRSSGSSVYKFIAMNKESGETVNEIERPSDMYFSDGASPLYYKEYIYYFGGFYLSTDFDSAKNRSVNLFKVNVNNLFK